MFPVIPLSQSHLCKFVMLDPAGVELPGIGAGGLTVQVSKGIAAFIPGVGAKTETSDGWYTYELTAAETDTAGPLAVMVDGAGAQQQNLLFYVQSGSVNAIEFTYTVTNSVTLLPIEGVNVWITTDLAGINVVWNGETDALGVARDGNGELPWLDPGTYYFWRQKAGFEFTDPDTEIVS